MLKESLDSFSVRSTLDIGGSEVDYFDLTALEKKGVGNVSHLPFSLKILLENLLRCEDGKAVTRNDIEALLGWNPKQEPEKEISFSPSRVILQDFTGVPAVVDLASMRDAMADIGGDPSKINPLVPSELIIDHSVQVDSFGSPDSFRVNVGREFERNFERYGLLRWGQSAFDGFRVVPPATGIIHQVNLEYLGRVVFRSLVGDREVVYPDTLVGTDSHTTMINGLGVLGWGVGGIEAEAAMLGQPISLLIPQVVGFKLKGSLPEGSTATDLVLTITEMLREKGVVSKFVEFYGPGMSALSLADRATIGNMCPEYGSTVAIFPIDSETLAYLDFTGRDSGQIELVEGYAKAQGIFHTDQSLEAIYSDSLELELGTVEPCIAGPKRPQDRIPLRQSKEAFGETLKVLDRNMDRMGDSIEIESTGGGTALAVARSVSTGVQVQLGDEFELKNGAVVIAAITSCTNTSNPMVMIGAGLLAKKAVERGLKSCPWVKTSLAPGSKVVTEYLEEAGLIYYLNQLRFNLVGYGCTTCIGNSGPLPELISQAVADNDLVVCAVLSGNRNFEGRINPDVRANYIASPPLVVAYSIAGRMDIDLYNEPLGQDITGEDVYLKDLWPSQEEIRTTIRSSVKSEMFSRKYGDVFTGDKEWQELPIPDGNQYDWEDSSTYIRKPPFFQGMPKEPEPVRDILDMRVLALLGDSVTPDHISPAGSIPKDGPAGRYLISQGVDPKDFNSFGSRRGNHEVMMRGTFANIRLRNLLVPGVEGGFTRHYSSLEVVSIFDAAMKYKEDNIPLIVVAGKEYGSGSSRDWAAKGSLLLGVRAVLAESFERIHRSNLVGMGILPLQFEPGENSETLGLTGLERYDVLGLEEGLTPRKKMTVRISSDEGEKNIQAISRVDTPDELSFYLHGGILQYVLRTLRD